MVDRLEETTTGPSATRLVNDGRERCLTPVSGDKAILHVAEPDHRGEGHPGTDGPGRLGRRDRDGAPLHRLSERVVRIVDTDPDDRNAVAERPDELGDAVIGIDRGGQQNGDVALAQQHRLTATQSRVRAAPTGESEAEI